MNRLPGPNYQVVVRSNADALGAPRRSGHLSAATKTTGDIRGSFEGLQASLVNRRLPIETVLAAYRTLIVSHVKQYGPGPGRLSTRQPFGPFSEPNHSPVLPLLLELSTAIKPNQATMTPVNTIAKITADGCSNFSPCSLTSSTIT
jgi:hypothetical protein